MLEVGIANSCEELSCKKLSRLVYPLLSPSAASEVAD